MNNITIMSNRRTTANIPEIFYIQDNKISSIRINLPQKIGDYVLNQCSIELRACIDDDYISYEIPTDNKFYDWQPTTDITEKSQTVNLVFYITADGGVIGRTKPIQLNIQVNPDKGEELTPREEFDEVIREQRAEIAEQAETISSQASQIEQDTETISGLNAQVSDLTTENEQLETQHTADQNTIQYLIENPPEARLQPKSVTPTNQMQVVEPDEGYQGLSTVTVGAVTPPRLQSKQVAPSLNTTYVSADSGYDGISSVTVDNVTASIDPNIQPENIKKDVVVVGVRGTYGPAYGTTAGGIYITAKNEYGYATKIVIKDWASKGTSLTLPFADNAKPYIQTIDFVGENDFTAIPNNTFANYTNLESFTIIPTITAIGRNAFLNTGLLSEVTIPQTVNSVDTSAFQNSTVTKVVFLANVATIPAYFLLAEGNHASRYSPLEAYIKEGITEIGAQAFTNRTRLWKLYLPATLTSVGYNAFLNVNRVSELTLGTGWNMSFNVYSLTSGVDVDVSVIVSWLEALADRTGETAYTLTMGTTNLNKLTAEQKAIATNKNWNLA